MCTCHGSEQGGRKERRYCKPSSGWRLLSVLRQHVHPASQPAESLLNVLVQSVYRSVGLNPVGDVMDDAVENMKVRLASQEQTLQTA
jgi:hypothetical protein